MQKGADCAASLERFTYLVMRSGLNMLFPSCHEPGRSGTEDTHRDQQPAERSAEKNRRIAVAEVQRAAQTVFADRSENETEYDRGGIQIELTDKVADDAEDEHDDDFNEVVMDREGAHHTEQEDGRNQDGVRQSGDLRKEAATD